MDEKKEARRLAVWLKIGGAVLFVIEFIALIIGAIILYRNFILVSQYNYYSKLKSTDKSCCVDRYCVYAKNDNVYASFEYYDSETYVYNNNYLLDSYDESYYYFKNDNETIKIRHREWINKLITKYQDAETDYTDNLIVKPDITDTKLNFEIVGDYYFYDAGDVMGLKARYQYVDIYEDVSHNKSGIKFKYLETYVCKGDELVSISQAPMRDLEMLIDSKSIIEDIQYEGIKLNEMNAWLVLIFMPIILVFIFAIAAFLFIIFAVMILTVPIITKLSMTRVSDNRILKGFGIVLFIFGCGIPLYFGAKFDEPYVKEIEDERNILIKKEREERELKKNTENNEAKGKAYQGKSSPLLGGILSGIGGALVSICIYALLFSAIFGVNLFKYTYYLQSSGHSLPAIAIICLVVGIILIRDHRNRLKAIEDDKAKEKEDEPIELSAVNYCKHCGTRINPDSLFCPNCGAKIKENDDNKDTLNMVDEESKEAESDIESDDYLDEEK